MDEIDVKVGSIFRQRRKDRRWTQTMLANRVGTSKQCIYYYEKGLRGLPISMFFKLCRALELDPDQVQSEVERR